MVTSGALLWCGGVVCGDIRGIVVVWCVVRVVR